VATFTSSQIPKTSASSQTEWTKLYSYPSCSTGYTYDTTCNPTSFIQTNDGGYAATVVFDNSRKGELIKFDSNGVIEWTVAFKSQYYMPDAILQQTADGGFLIKTGNTFMKLDQTGSLQWNKTYFTTQNYAPTGISNFTQTIDGGVIFYGQKAISSVSYDSWLEKLNNVGDIQWSKTYHFQGNSSFTSMVELNNQYILAGYQPGYNEFIAKIDTSGNTQSITNLLDTENVSLVNIVKTNDNCILLSGFKNDLNSDNGLNSHYSDGYDAWVMKLDSSQKQLWNRTYGGANEDVAVMSFVASDGGVVFNGGTCSYGFGNPDGWLFKIDSNGNIIMSKTYGWYNATAWSLTACIQTTDGGYLLPLTTNYTSPIPSFGLIKTDSNGVTSLVPTILVAPEPRLHLPGSQEWDKTYGGSGIETATSMIQTGDGGYSLAGITNSFGAGGQDAWLVKTDLTGKQQWNKTYGGTNDDYVSSIVQTNDGGYALAGYTYSYGAGNQDCWLIKTDSAGNQQWSKTYGGTMYDSAQSVIQSNDGGFIICGTTNSTGAGAQDLFLVRTDSSGNQLWTKTFGGTRNDYGTSLVQAADGGYAVVGFTLSFGAGGPDAWLIKIDSIGKQIWSKTYGGTGDDSIYAVAQTNDGGYALAGYTQSYGAGSYDFWLTKTDSLGNSLWTKTYGGTADDYALSLVNLPNGGYAIGGYTESSGSGNGDFWLVRTNSDGNQLWNKTYGGTDYDFCFSLVNTIDGGYALAGYTYSWGSNGDFWLVKVPADTGTTVMLNVPYQGQGYAGWCSPTSLAMVLRYYGHSFHSWDYAKDALLDCKSGVQIQNFGDYLTKNFPDLTYQTRYYYNPFSKEQIFYDMQTDLTNGYPVIMQLNLPLSGHVVVAVGFNQTGLFINDPSGFLFNDLLRKPVDNNFQVYVSYDDINKYVVTWPYASTLTIKGTPYPDNSLQTMYLEGDNNIAFYNPQLNIFDTRTQLYLTKGLNWNYTYIDGSRLDPVIDPKLSYLWTSVYVSNGEDKSVSLTANCKIKGPDGRIYFDENQAVNAGPKIAHTPVLWSKANLQALPAGGPYSLTILLTNSKGTIVDSLTAPPFYWGGQFIQLTENQHHLYLHVYDTAGNHVGINYATNQTELGITGSYYFDTGNGTITVALLSTDKVKVVVDAKYAEEQTESYNVTISSKADTVSTIIYSNNITVGTTQIVADLTPSPTSSPTPTPTLTSSPSSNPTTAPTTQPTINPTTKPTSNPTVQPTAKLSTQNPTLAPSTTPNIPEYSIEIILALLALTMLTLVAARKRNYSFSSMEKDRRKRET
jgi:hypothetical protein